ncbi:sensor histidine kinase [Priestia taiwanensis]|uniref:histidine kinase n=1 Tax=Priestia taiwanensis TaxID=1347902 RepID=A0A917AJP6_9BACI|nr:ATP-binding protein [Priestia taiwanensis]MBM7361781.1 signal transduction histidine kinase [Priestia taiwanensis]GGE56941.1 two-component sensor histidine kinase [Priestia taiwanensis]
MKKISFKLAFYFLLVTVLIESILFISLYTTIVHSRVQEELDALLARGNSHRDVLQKHFDDTTISHVALMESEAETKVIITDANRNILAQSKNINKEMKIHLHTDLSAVPSTGMVLDDHWRSSDYICSISPIISNEEVQGYVYMFLETESIKALVEKITFKFTITALLTVCVSICTAFFFSRIITKPLVRMKKATEKLSNGDFTVVLQTTSNDELGELAASIQKLANDLHYMRQERSEFLASVAHELRTPLTFVKGYADIAKRSHISDDERTEYLSIIKEEVEHLTRLIQDLFTLAQMEQHTLTIEKEHVHLYDYLEKITAKLKPTLASKNMHIHIHCSSLLTASLDKVRFEQVLLNLLLNAYKYSNTDASISIILTQHHGQTVWRIEDQGVGIPEQDLPHLYDKFYRVDKSRTRSTGGTGLGLSIVKEIVELHGGTISIESQLHVGTTVTIALPTN